MKDKELLDLLGQPDSKQSGQGLQPYEDWRYDRLGLTATVLLGEYPTVFYVTTDRSGMTSGVQVGDRLERVVAVYGLPQWASERSATWDWYTGSNGCFDSFSMKFEGDVVTEINLWKHYWD